MDFFKKINYRLILFILISILLSRAVMWQVYKFNAHDGINFFEAMYQNDCGWYGNIVLDGYYTPEEIHDGSANWAFFPLYPLIIKGVLSLVDINIEIVSFFVSNIILFMALYIAAKYTYKTRGSYLQSAIFIILMTFGAYSLYFSIFYSEVLFFLFIISGLYFLENKNYIGAGICGAFLSATRMVGVFFVIAIAVKYCFEYFVSKKITVKNLREFILDALKDYKFVLGVLIVPLGLFLYMLNLANIIGDPFAFLRTQIAWNREITGLPWTTLIKGIEQFGIDMEGFYYATYFIVAIYFTIASLHNKRFVEGSLSIVFILIPLISGQLYSSPRFLIGTVVLPLTFTDQIMKTERYSQVFIIVAWCLFEITCLNAWVNGIYIMW